MEKSNPDTETMLQVGKEEACSPASSASSIQRENWTEAQEFLKKKLITEDDFTWKIPRHRSENPRRFIEEEEEEEEMGEVLKYVGGVDISFSKEDPSLACGSLLVLDLHSLQVVYEDFSVVTLNIPYVPGFLAFREAPVLLGLLERMKSNSSPFYPQVLMVDGNGILHPRDKGRIPYIFIPFRCHDKCQLHHVDGLTISGVRQLLKCKEHDGEDFIPLTGCSGRVWGVAMRSTEGSFKPILISIGHRISLDTAITIVKMTCKYRVPEPTRQFAVTEKFPGCKNRCEAGKMVKEGIE